MSHRHIHQHLRHGRHEIANVENRAANINSPPAMDMLEQITGLPVPMPNRVVIRSDSTATSSSSATATSCAADDNSAACEKPVSSASTTLPIILGVTIPVIGSFILFLWLHRRHVRRQREEDANDKTNSMDFGLDHVPGLPGKRTFEEPIDENDAREKGRSGRPRQMSMDMQMVSPYLLPAELQSSRESLHSLSRTIHQNEDPYRPITQYLDDKGSIRSKRPHDGSSIYTGSSGAPSRFQDNDRKELLSDAAHMPRSNPPGFRPPPRYNSSALSDATNSPVSPIESPIDRKYPLDNKSPIEPRSPRSPLSSPLDDEKRGLEKKAAPTGALPPTPKPGLSPTPPKPAELRDSKNSDQLGGDRNSNSYLGAVIASQSSSPEPQVPKPALLQTSNRKEPPPGINTLPASPKPPQPPTLVMPLAPKTDDSDDDYDAFQVTPPSPTQEEEMRGRRYSMDVPPEEFAQAGLGAPGFDPKRISMGFRPLPPNEGLEVEDPEVRANRIRSFYKEYFDDSKPPPPGQYYEDVDENYLGDVAYFDPESNNFVMPYAEPVTRRAMTPPPRGPPRFMGPRPRMGSMGAMSVGGPGPRAASSASNIRPGPRAPRKPFVPPQDLTTLPTPAKLRDDSFALMHSHEFAPPTSFRDRQLGRSESPLGERRPYSPSVRPHTPLASAFDDLPAMPSPHLLRKSGTFTALDFAPPRRIRDPDTMSDAGSIRSARSGISAVQHDAVRRGAYRVSRLPANAVGTKDDMANSLKPNWKLGY